MTYTNKKEDLFVYLIQITDFFLFLFYKRIKQNNKVKYHVKMDLYLKTITFNNVSANKEDRSTFVIIKEGGI